MPTLIVLDCSLSMLRLAHPTPQQQSQQQTTPVPDSPDDPAPPSSDGHPLPHQLIHLAKHGLDLLLEHLQLNYKLEHVALLAFASQCELVAPFSRDVADLRQQLANVDCFDRTNLASGLRGIASAVEEHWGSSVPVSVILVTDGGLGHGPLSLAQLTATPNGCDKVLPFAFKGRFSVLCVNGPKDAAPSRAAYEKLIERTGLADGGFFLPENELSQSSVEKMFRQVIETQYKQYVGTLNFGDELSCKVTLCPPPSAYKCVKDFEVIEADFSDTLDLKGFLTLADVASPPVISRHLILPWTGCAPTDEDSRAPNLCVFLHGALKVENMCALVQVGSNPYWFGILFSCADTKKRSNLMLGLFEPGCTPVPWLGDLTNLGPLAGLNATNQEPFPVRCDHKPSYSAAPVVWIKQASLHSDVQKILRHARKLPDKTPHFYKELNRLKRHALCIGFHSLLEGVAATFERECNALPATAHPDCAIQLTHAASELRSRQVLSLDYVVQPVGKYGKKDL